MTSSTCPISRTLLYPLSYGGFGSHRDRARAECSPTVTLGARVHGSRAT
jgi:hypothetical protein